MTKFFAIVLTVVVSYTDARMIRMSHGNSFSCRHSIQRERDNAVKKHNEIAENFDSYTLTRNYPDFTSKNVIINYHDKKKSKTFLH